MHIYDTLLLFFGLLLTIIISMDLLKLGQKLSLCFQKEGNIVEITCSISQILADRLVIELPPYFMRYIEYLEVGKRLTVKVFSKLGTIDFNTVVITSPLEESFSVELDYNAMKLTPGKDIPFVNAIELMNLRAGDLELTVKTFEISTEYIKFYSDKSLNIGEVFECELLLPKNYGTISFKITLTEVDPVYDNEYTAVYSTMSEENRQALLYYMYLYSNNSD